MEQRASISHTFVYVCNVSVCYSINKSSHFEAVRDADQTYNFLAKNSSYSFEDFKKQLAVHNRKYNNFPMRPLNWKSPADYLNAFLSNGEVF